MSRQPVFYRKNFFEKALTDQSLVRLTYRNKKRKEKDSELTAIKRGKRQQKNKKTKEKKQKTTKRKKDRQNKNNKTKKERQNKQKDLRRITK